MTLAPTPSRRRGCRGGRRVDRLASSLLRQSFLGSYSQPKLPFGGEARAAYGCGPCRCQLRLPGKPKGSLKVDSD